MATVARRRPWAVWAGAARGECLLGKRERETQGFHPPAHLGRRRLEEVARLGPAGGGGGGCGGGAAGRGAGATVAA